MALKRVLSQVPDRAAMPHWQDTGSQPERPTGSNASASVSLCCDAALCSCITLLCILLCAGSQTAAAPCSDVLHRCLVHATDRWSTSVICCHANCCYVWPQQSRINGTFDGSNGAGWPL